MAMLQPSPRTPTMSSHLNPADNIARHLAEDNHRTWGLVIYRCTYASDSDWAEFVRRFRTVIHDSLQMCNGLDLFDSLAFTVFEDRDKLDDASTASIREHFSRWVVEAVAREQGDGVVAGLGQRYRFCIQVDEASVESVVEDLAPTQPPIALDGWVNVVKRDWRPVAVEGDEEEEEDEIEGCTQHDVGWMMVNYQSVMVDFCVLLRGLNEWYREYRRPPEVAVA